jgi:hypothetical protein
MDKWIAQQIANEIEKLGAKTFLYEVDIVGGDDIEDRIKEAARRCKELLVLLTPWALKRPYIWLEMGAVWGRGGRIVGVLYGLTPKDLVGTPALLGRTVLVQLNEIGKYLCELKNRIKKQS